MKIASIIDALHAAQAHGSTLQYRLIHTGQHYDRAMSGSFFEQLGIPEPHVNLEVGSGTAAEQTAAIMTRYEKVLLEKPKDYPNTGPQVGRGVPAEPSRQVRGPGPVDGPRLTEDGSPYPGTRERDRRLGRASCDLCLVVGDVTSTMACAIAAQKVGVPVAHVEGGIRSGDWSMPEEINRLVTDAITNYFFTTSEAANANLRRSGVGDDRIFFVGNTMIDTLLKQRPRFQPPAVWRQAGLREKEYFVLTLHRPANVDSDATLQALMAEILRGARGRPIVFPVHPRTARTLNRIGMAGHGPRNASSPSSVPAESPIHRSCRGDEAVTAVAAEPLPPDVGSYTELRRLPLEGAAPSAPPAASDATYNPSRPPSIPSPAPNLFLTEPLAYLEFNYLVERAFAVITDSGGITEETTVLGVPCLTLRDTTERPETVTLGTNELVGTDPAKLAPHLDRLFAGKWKRGSIPPQWDGRTGARIVTCLETILSKV